MRERVYALLVNRVLGIRQRFMNMREALALPFYEEKVLYYKGSESGLDERKSPKELADTLGVYDVISLDVFDTLIFRPFSSPKDLFYFVGMKLHYPGFYQVRISAEEKAREKKLSWANTREVTLEEIWECVQEQTGIPAGEGMEVEWETELGCCYANPYMMQVVELLRKLGKRLIVVTDMYLGEERILKLLEHCGYSTFDGCFISCDYGRSKGDGGLYHIVLNRMGREMTYAHVGDQERADRVQALRAGLRGYHYPNVQEMGNRFRTEDMSVVTGSVYRGIVNAWIHSGLQTYSREYEYGFIYGGLFVAGYCRFIHEYASSHEIEKLLFLSRDGAVLHTAYRKMYPSKAKYTEYVYWSRLAGMKVTARYFRHDYFQRFLDHKVNRGFSVRWILEEMDLTAFLEDLEETTGLHPETELTNRNVEILRKYVKDSWTKVMGIYEEQRQAAKKYFTSIVEGCKSAAVVDIGWAGSSAWMLDYAINQQWKLGCEITGILAGTNMHPKGHLDEAEPYLLQGKLISYLYSPGMNRDLWKLHNPSKGHNLYWELLMSAPHGSLKGFYLNPEGACVFQFQKMDPKVGGRIQEIHRGILDFVEQFLKAEQRVGYQIPISGRDAYAPMLSIASRKNRMFMKELEGGRVDHSI